MSFDWFWSTPHSLFYCEPSIAVDMDDDNDGIPDVDDLDDDGDGINDMEDPDWLGHDEM